MEIQNKSILAKLLAAENVTLEHRQVATASFDLKSRTLTLPIWKEMSADLYDLFIGHEVGHALYTPMQGWHDNVMEYGPAFRSFLNVIEDARIERKIKEKFPGLVRNFYAGYRELFSQNFFGVEGRDLSTLALIDRINLHFKVGNMLGVPFSPEEEGYLSRIEQAETWGDVVDIAESLFAKAKDEGESETQTDHDFGPESEDSEESGESMPQPEQSEGEEESDDEGEGEGDAEGEEESDSESEQGKSSSDESEESTEEESTSGNIGTHDAEDEGDKEPVSETDNSFRESEESLISEENLQNYYAEWPKIDPKNWVYPASKTWKHVRWDQVFVQRYHSEHGSQNVVGSITQEVTADFKRKNSAVINQMLQRFEMKRKASTLARARTNKTGELNMKKLWATKLTEDVFLSNTVTPQGTNHGMMMVIDFSGSMFNDISATVQQTLVMVEFCKKANIPFDVYLFTNNSDSTMPYRSHEQMQVLARGFQGRNMAITDDSFHLVQLINSDMSPVMYKSSFTNMLLLAAAYTQSPSTRGPSAKYWYNHYNLPACLQTGGTPLLESLVVVRELVNNFQRSKNIEKMNTIFLTDGEPTGELWLGEDFTGQWGWSRNASSVMISEKNLVTEYKLPRGRRQSERGYIYKAALQHFKATTNTNFVNFYIGQFGASWKLEGKYEYIAGTSNGFDEFKKSWKTNKFGEINSGVGFDATYIIKNGDNLAQEDLELDVKSDKKSDLLRGFKKFQSKKTGNAMFLGKFIDMVA